MGATLFVVIPGELAIECHKYSLTATYPVDITFGIYNRLLSHWWGYPVIYVMCYVYWLWVFFLYTEGLLAPQRRRNLHMYIKRHKI